MPAFKNLNNDSGLKELNDYLASRSYIQGYTVSAEDFAVFQQLPHNVNSDKFAHVARFYKHIRAQPENVVAALSGESKSAPASSPAHKAATPKQKPASPKQSPKQKPATPQSKPVEAAGNDDDDFSFDDDPEESKKKLEELQKKAEEDKKKKKEKEKPVAKSSLVFDIKPEELETDMVALEKTVREITKDGLHWGAAQLIPIAYGIKKLRIMCTVVDDLVSVDDIQEDMEKIPGVQSTDIYAFNKI